jgi:predicted nucleotidyltransferase component of viral defense system
MLNPETIKSKLNKLSVAKKVSAQKLYGMYFLERLLYRIVNSSYKDKFILRGSSLLYIIESDDMARPTKDIDLMGMHISNTPREMVEIFRKIVKVHCDDCVTFLENTIRATIINLEKEYNGVRIFMDATAFNVKRTISIDIGFDDIITPNPNVRHFPSLLKDENIPDFDVRTYTLETSLSEKIEAIISKAEYTSRWKDFYDIWFILNKLNVDRKVLKKALRNTFSHRNTKIDADSIVFSIEYYLNPERTRCWNLFMTKNNIIPKISFYDVGLFISTTVKNIISNA